MPDVKLLPAPKKENIIEYADGHFAPERTVEDVPGVGKVFIGQDLRLYRRTTGLMALIAPCDPVKDTKPGLWIDKVEWEDFPPIGQVKYLNGEFFQKFKREVMVLIYKKWDDSGWFFMVPKQVGTTASIKWEDKEGTQWGLQWGRYVGTIHIHPGESATPSDTDRTWWAERDASGLHLILGRTGKYTVSGSCAGHVINLVEGTLDEHKEGPEKAQLITSMNKPLKELLLIPPPEPKKKVYQTSRYGGHTTGQQQFQYHRDIRTDNDEDESFRPDYEADAAYDAVVQAGGMLLDARDIEDLRVLLMPDGTTAIVTPKQWVNIALAMHDWEVDVPRSVPLKKYMGEYGEENNGLHFG